jgi:hypothetical protein
MMIAIESTRVCIGAIENQGPTDRKGTRKPATVQGSVNSVTSNQHKPEIQFKAAKRGLYTINQYMKNPARKTT